MIYSTTGYQIGLWGLILAPGGLFWLTPLMPCSAWPTPHCPSLLNHFPLPFFMPQPPTIASCHASPATSSLVISIHLCSTLFCLLFVSHSHCHWWASPMELFDFNQLLVEEVLLQYCRALVANFEIQYDWFGWHVVPNQWLPLACASGYICDWFTFNVYINLFFPVK